jgi:CheY-like chemotaxis protein
LVEDDPHDAYFVYQSLEAAQIKNQVVACRDADEARRLLTREGAVLAPVLFIIDIHLDVRENGIDFLRWIRAQPAPLGATPVMILTASEQPEHLESAQRLDAMWVLQKPVTQAQLLDAVQALGFSVVTNLASGDVGLRILERK